MNSKIRDKWTDGLFEAILLLEDLEECYNFFEDICTVAEIKAMAQRLEVAKMLRTGLYYIDIAKNRASTATISRVNRCLVYGADGYRTILTGLKRSTGAKPEKIRKENPEGDTGQNLRES